MALNTRVSAVRRNFPFFLGHPAAYFDIAVRILRHPKQERLEPQSDWDNPYLVEVRAIKDFQAYLPISRKVETIKVHHLVPG
jgi:hypothetical protein